MQRVTSRNNPRVHEAARLIASSRDRRKAGKCVLEGEHLIAVYLDRVGAPESLLVVDDDAGASRGSPRSSRGCPRTTCWRYRRRSSPKCSTLPAAVGAVAVVPTPAPSLPPPAGFHLLLDDLQDPGNVGTMLRTAAAAGVEQVLLSKHCAFAWSPKALRAGQGAHFLTTIVEDVDLRRVGARVSRAARARGRDRRARRPRSLRRAAGRAARHRDRQRGRGRIRAAPRDARTSASRSRCRAAWNRSTPPPPPRSCCSRRCASAGPRRASVEDGGEVAAVDAAVVERARPTGPRCPAASPCTLRHVGRRL